MIKTNYFRKGDLVQLKDRTLIGPNPFGFNSGRIYQITRIEDTQQVSLSWQRSTFSLEDLRPIPINGRDDYAIRLQISKADPCVMDGMKLPHADKDFDYYLDRIQALGWDGLLDEIKQHNIKYVHQVQRYLDEHLANWQLTLY